MQLTYPGVYVQEIPSSVRPIATVSTSIGAFIDFFPQGPVNKAVQIFGMADFERIYGAIDQRSAASYQIAQFFLNGGPSAWVVRVAPGAKKASATVADKAGGTDSFTADALDEGDWGNDVRVAIEPVADATGAIDAKTFNLIVSRYASADSSRPPLASEKFLNLSIDPTLPRYFPKVVNGASQLVAVTPASATPPLPAPNGTLGAKIDTTTLSLNALNTTTFTATIGGATATCTLDIPNQTGAADKDLRLLRGFVEAALHKGGATATTPIPALVGATVTLVGNSLWIKASTRSPSYKPTDTIAIAGTSAGALGFATAAANTQEYVLGLTTATGAQTAGVKGDDGTGTTLPFKLPKAADLIGDPATKKGLYALDDVDLFNILCLPRAVDDDFDSFTAIMSEAVAYCEKRRAFLIVDIPTSANTPQAVQDWVDANASSIKSANTAVYFPRVEVPDPANEFRLRSIGASGTMAGIYARTDTDRGVWKAPAGIDTALRGVAALDYQTSDGENGVLNPLGIDCLRNFPIYGQIAWGARTLVGADAIASEWKYIPIRRLALMIEESLFRGTKWVVFEPNDEPLWAKIRQNVGAFMTGLFRQGAFQGSTPDKAFFVKCDGETTTANDRNLGVVNIEVGFAPLKPAEFVVLKIQQIPDVA